MLLLSAQSKTTAKTRAVPRNLRRTDAKAAAAAPAARWQRPTAGIGV